MPRKIIGMIMVIGCAAVFAGGCAKNGVVKQDEQIAPPTAKAAEQKQSDAAAEAAAKAKEAAAVKEEAVKAQPVTADATADGKAAANAAATEKGLETVYFDFDSYILQDGAKAALSADYAWLKGHPKAKVQIAGNCDERGSDEYNLALGEKRARTALSYLTAMGIPADQLTTISYGKEKPAVDGHDEQSWSKNRRDEFVILNK